MKYKLLYTALLAGGLATTAPALDIIKGYAAGQAQADPACQPRPRNPNCQYTCMSRKCTVSARSLPSQIDGACAKWACTAVRKTIPSNKMIRN